jgi:hypothetical protein
VGWIARPYHQASGRAPCNVEHGQCPAYAGALGQGLTARSIWQGTWCAASRMHVRQRARQDVRCTAKMGRFAHKQVRIVNMACAVRDASRVHADHAESFVSSLPLGSRRTNSSVNNSAQSLAGGCLASSKQQCPSNREYVKQDRRSVALADTSYCMGMGRAAGHRPTYWPLGPIRRQPVTCYAGAVPSVQGRNSTLDDGPPMQRAECQRLTTARLLPYK